MTPSKLVLNSSRGRVRPASSLFNVRNQKKIQHVKIQEIGSWGIVWVKFWPGNTPLSEQRELELCPRGGFTPQGQGEAFSHWAKLRDGFDNVVWLNCHLFGHVVGVHCSFVVREGLYQLLGLSGDYFGLKGTVP